VGFTRCSLGGLGSPRPQDSDEGEKVPRFFCGHILIIGTQTNNYFKTKQKPMGRWDITGKN